MQLELRFYDDSNEADILISHFQLGAYGLVYVSVLRIRFMLKHSKPAKESMIFGIVALVRHQTRDHGLKKSLKQ